MAIKDRLHGIAKEMAQEYFKESSIDLTDLLMAIAEEKHLNQYEVERIAEMVNHMIRGKLYTDPDLDQSIVSFKVADPEKIRTTIPLEEKTDELYPDDVESGSCEDYMLPPGKVLVRKKVIIIKKASAPESFIHITEGQLEDAMSDLRIAMNKVAESRSRLASEIQHQLEYGTSLEKIAKIAQESVDLEVLHSTLDKLSSEVNRWDFQDFDNLIDHNLDAVFIKGDSPLIIKFKQYQKDIQKARDAYKTVKDYKSILLQKQAAEAPVPAAKTGQGGFGKAFGYMYAGSVALDNWKTDKAQLAMFEQLKKDKGARAQLFNKMINKYPGTFAKHKKYFDGSWLMDSPVNKAIKQKRLGRPGDKERFPALKFHDSIDNLLDGKELNKIERSFYGE